MRIHPSFNSTSLRCFADLCKILSPYTHNSEIRHIKDSIDRSPTYWHKIAMYANRSNLAPALCQALHNKELWDIAPPAFQEYLSEMYKFNVQRNEALTQQLREAIVILNKAGMTPMPLKGAAALISDIFPDIAVRFMWDLDILVASDDLMHSVTALISAGYSVPEIFHGWATDQAKHYAPMIKQGTDAHIEIHRNVLDAAEEKLLKTENVWRDSQMIISGNLPDITFSVMSPTHQVLHCVIHSELSHENYKMVRLDLRQMLNFVHIVKRYQNEIDWNQVTELMDDRYLGRMFRAYFYTAHKLFGALTPFTTDPSPEAIMHFSKIMHFQIDGKWKQIRMIKGEIEHILEAFSEQGLRIRFPDKQNCSTSKLRINLMKILYNRYPTCSTLKEYMVKKLYSFVRIG